MPVAFRTQPVSIPTGTGPRTIESSVTFPSRVNSAAVALNGFQLDFNNGDHHINEVEADTDLLGIAGNTVRFRVQARYADKNFDDPYHGYITALVIADID